jgi:hypothetical protein
MEQDTLKKTETEFRYEVWICLLVGSHCAITIWLVPVLISSKILNFFPWFPTGCLLIWFSDRSENLKFWIHFSHWSLSRFQWPRDLRRRSTTARLLWSWVRIPPEALVFHVCVVCCQVEVSAELITRPEESYRLWRLCVITKPRDTRRP